jgi:hypothetical protein
MLAFTVVFLFLTSITFCANQEWKLIRPMQPNPQMKGTVWGRDGNYFLLGGIETPRQYQNVFELETKGKLLFYDTNSSYTVVIQCSTIIHDKEGMNHFLAYAASKGGNDEDKKIYLPNDFEPAGISISPDHVSIAWSKDNKICIVTPTMIDKKYGQRLSSIACSFEKNFPFANSKMIKRHALTNSLVVLDSGGVIHQMKKKGSAFETCYTFKGLPPFDYFAINNTEKNDTELFAAVSDSDCMVIVGGFGGTILRRLSNMILTWPIFDETNGGKLGALFYYPSSVGGKRNLRDLTKPYTEMKIVEYPEWSPLISKEKNRESKENHNQSKSKKERELLKKEEVFAEAVGKIQKIPKKNKTKKYPYYILGFAILISLIGSIYYWAK